MEVVYSGKQVKKVITQKIEKIESSINAYMERLKFDGELLKAALEEYDKKSFWFKLKNKRPTLDRIRGIENKWERSWHTDYEFEVMLLEGEINKLKKIKNALDDESQVILSEEDIIYYNLKN